MQARPPASQPARALCSCAEKIVFFSHPRCGLAPDLFDGPSKIWSRNMVPHTRWLGAQYSWPRITFGRRAYLDQLHRHAPCHPQNAKASPALGKTVFEAPRDEGRQKYSSTDSDPSAPRRRTAGSYATTCARDTSKRSRQSPRSCAQTDQPTLAAAKQYPSQSTGMSLTGNQAARARPTLPRQDAGGESCFRGRASG